MTIHKSILLFSIFLFAFFEPVFAQSLPAKPVKQVNVPELRKEANRAFYAKDYPAFLAAIEELTRARPNNSEYMYQLVLAYSLLNKKTAAYNVMLEMQRQGLAYDFNQNPATEKIRDTDLYQYLNDLMIRAGEPMGKAEVVVTLLPDIHFPEAIAWDADRNSFLIGTVANGTILAVDKENASEELIRADRVNGLWGIYGLALDVKRNRLWATSSANSMFAGTDPMDNGRSVLVEFDLKTMEVLEKYPVPVDGRPHNLANVVVSNDGDVYVADGLIPVVYIKKSGESVLKPFFASRKLVSLRGMALSDTDDKLYLADYEMGITVIDIKAGKSASLAASETLNLGGIDGLYFWNGSLVIIQNGISPDRVMRLGLDSTGSAVTEVAPVAVALKLMDAPNYGVIVGDELNFFANSHWGSVGKELRPVTILSADLANVPEIITPDEKQFMEQYQQSEERKTREKEATQAAGETGKAKGK